MNIAEQDVELLRAFVRQGDESAFAALVQRHLDLVYGTAWRKLGDPAGAEETAQDVFLALARSAWQFAPEDSVPAWLHRTTILKSKQWLRGEMRRRRREGVAAQLGTTMKTPEEQPALRALLPLLDEALLSLSEADRAALLLRYFESRPLREVGLSLGVGEDAAQKRVAIALQRISRFFQRRGFQTATATVVAAALQQTATSAPAPLAHAVVQVAIHSAPPAVTGVTALLARLAGLSKAQTATLCVALAAAPISWQWSQTHAVEKRVAALETALKAAHLDQEAAAVQTEHLRGEYARLQAALAPAAAATPERTEAATRALGELRQRLVHLATAAQAQWPEDLPFVRVPKWALKDIGSREPAFGPTGALAQWTQEALDLSPPQKEAVESHLAEYLNSIDRLAASRAAETNWASADGFFHKTVTVAPLGAEGQQAEDQLSSNLVAMLGPEASRLIMGPFFSTSQWFSTERIAHALIDSAQEFKLSVRPKAAEPADVSVAWQYHLAHGGPIYEGSVPPFLMDRFQPWLRQLGLSSNVFYQRAP